MPHCPFLPKRPALASLVILAFGSALSCSCAWASLGGSAGSIQQDGQPVASTSARSFAAHVISSFSAAGTSSYSVQTVQSGNVAIAEYVNASTGQVFAVSWEGPTMPDLRQILNATNFHALEAAVAQHPVHAVGGALHIELQDLVVTASGHMGHFVGAAYQPSLMPPNFNPSSLLR